MPEFIQPPTKLNVANVTKGRRVTLPHVTVGMIEENDQLVFRKLDNGDFLISKLNVRSIQPSEKKVLYGIEIGQSLGNGRWYGIIVDKDGLIKTRVSSSQRSYLYKDMSELSNQATRDKLNTKCGVNGWHFPIVIKRGEAVHLPTEVVKVVNECRIGLDNGCWPLTN